MAADPKPVPPLKPTPPAPSPKETPKSPDALIEELKKTAEAQGVPLAKLLARLIEQSFSKDKKG